MEQAGAAAGDQASGPGADEVVRWRGACAASLVSSRPGGSGNPLLGYYGPCARSSLTARSEIAGTRKRGPEPGERRKAFARAAAECREASVLQPRTRRASQARNGWLRLAALRPLLYFLL